jgi:hypothetical protein
LENKYGTSWGQILTFHGDGFIVQLEYTNASYVFSCWPITNYGHNNQSIEHHRKFQRVFCDGYHKGRYFADKITHRGLIFDTADDRFNYGGNIYKIMMATIWTVCCKWGEKSFLFIGYSRRIFSKSN